MAAPAQIKVGPVPDFTKVVLGDVIRPIAERHAARALATIRSRWPVDSGKSRDGWRVEVDVSPGGMVKLALVNPVAYASYVHQRGGGPSALALADAVLRDVVPVMNEEIGKAIAEAYSRAPMSRGGAHV